MTIREGFRASARLTLAAAAGLALLLAACGGDDGAGDVAAAEDTLRGFIEGWEAASGVRSDTLRAGQVRRHLGGDLGASVQGVRAGEGLERRYNEMVGAPFPPDNGFEIVGEPEVGETEATFRVLLKYNSNAAARMAATGLIPFEDVREMQAEISDGLERTFILRFDDEAGWRIHEIHE